MTLKFEQSQFVWLTLITMTWSGCLEDVIAGDHVVHHAALGDLLGPDDLWRREVHAIIVQRLVWFVAGNWGGLQSHKQKKILIRSSETSNVWNNDAECDGVIKPCDYVAIPLGIYCP